MEKDNLISETEALKDAQIKALQDQVATLMKLVGQGTSSTTNPTSLNTERIKIVHLVDRAPGLSTLISLSNLEISMNQFGEERSLSIQQFEELIGKYRSWFSAGILAVHSDYEEAAKHYGLKTNAKYPLNSSFYKKLGDISMKELEDVFPRLPQAGKDSLISYWVRKAREGDRKFADIGKIETLNRLSNRALTQLIAELNAKQQ